MDSPIDTIIHGRCESVMKTFPQESISLSFWSPPYFLGKSYEQGETYDTWQALLKSAIRAHYRILKPGGFLVINIADILAFPDPKIPRYQAMNAAHHKSPVTREMVLAAKASNPHFSR